MLVKSHLIAKTGANTPVTYHTVNAVGDYLYMGCNNPDKDTLVAVPVSPVTYEVKNGLLFPNGVWATKPISEEEALRLFRENRANLLASATITYNGLTYDADEVSRSRMLSAIEAAQTLGSPVIPFWKMADNVKAENIPLADFKIAHAQIMLYMSSIWNPA